MADFYTEFLAELPRDEWGHPVLPMPERMDRKEYARRLMALQIELVKMQTWAREHGERVLLLFEGRDTAGKGGTIQRMREHMNPRYARHVALPAPNETEAGQWYFQRYVEQLPTKGEIAFFDRSWYNRAGVERVMGFAASADVGLFFDQRWEGLTSGPISWTIGIGECLNHLTKACGDSKSGGGAWSRGRWNC